MALKNVSIKKRADISRNVILVLLILTIILSGISTWVVIDTINQLKQQYLSVPSIQKGQISVTVLPGEGRGAAIGTESKVTGGVTFTVLPPVS